jgi:hypothetical protein
MLYKILGIAVIIAIGIYLCLNHRLSKSRKRLPEFQPNKDMMQNLFWILMIVAYLFGALIVEPWRDICFIFAIVGLIYLYYERLFRNLGGGHHFGPGWVYSGDDIRYIEANQEVNLKPTEYFVSGRENRPVEVLAINGGSTRAKLIFVVLSGIPYEQFQGIISTVTEAWEKKANELFGEIDGVRFANAHGFDVGDCPSEERFRSELNFPEANSEVAIYVEDLMIIHPQLS